MYIEDTLKPLNGMFTRPRPWTVSNSPAASPELGHILTISWQRNRRTMELSQDHVRIP